MNRPIEFTRGARSDVRSAFHWYETHEPGLGRDLVECIDEATEAIVNRPFSFAILHDEDRRALIRRFPYAVYFRVSEEKIIVTAVVHGARKPEQIRRLLRRKF